MQIQSKSMDFFLRSRPQSHNLEQYKYKNTNAFLLQPNSNTQIQIQREDRGYSFLITRPRPPAPGSVCAHLDLLGSSPVFPNIEKRNTKHKKDFHYSMPLINCPTR